MLAMIQSDIGPACTRCKLHTLGRKQIVFGVGNPRGAPDVCRRRLAPMKTSRVPFVGRAGQLLAKIIEAIGLTRRRLLDGQIKCRLPAESQSRA